MGKVPPARPGGTPWGARLIWASTIIDRAYRMFDRARGEIVLAVATDGVLDGCNNLIYGTTPLYRADSSAFRPRLFPWEQRAVERFFPPPPARVLIGGVGGGREAFALAAHGYQVVAFDPSLLLMETMVSRCGDEASIVPLIGGYEDLPRLRDPSTGKWVELSDFGVFDAGVLGWASYSHLRSEEQREYALSQFGTWVRGPILMSFFRGAEPEGKERKPRRLRRWLPGKFNRDPGNAFSVHIGFYHHVSLERLKTNADRCGLQLLYLDREENAETWPHAVLAARSDTRGDPTAGTQVAYRTDGADG